MRGMTLLREAIDAAPIQWPDGKDFAFTVFDDTDEAFVRNVGPVYDFLYDLGFRTTKSVWPGKDPEDPITFGETLKVPGYLDWILKLKNRGFEISYHLASSRSTTRDDTIRGLEAFKAHFGCYPRTMANHDDCRDNIYWGAERLSSWRKKIFAVGERLSGREAYVGHQASSPYFWGDHCREKITYVRNFVFNDINTLKACPYMPYFDPRRPYVNRWFAGAEGAVADSFVKTISEINVDRLEEEAGCCIMYTHFAYGFYRDGRLHPRFKELMTRIAAKNVWLTTTSNLLDYIAEQKGIHNLVDKERKQLEYHWLKQRLLYRR